MKGVLITFEGIEGCGKSTQAGLFHEWLVGRGKDVILTREPGGTALGEAVRNVLLHAGDIEIDAAAELLLYIACRAQLVREVISPSVSAGTIVLVDRFSDSTIAYQGRGRGLDIGMIREINRVATGGIVPDITFVFDVETRLGLSRASGRSATALPDRMEAEKMSFHQRVREGFLELAREKGRYRLLDGRKTVDAIQQELRSIFSAFLEERGMG